MSFLLHSVKADPSDPAGPPCDHVVQFYETDDYLIRSIEGFVTTGFRLGETCIVVATEKHHAQLSKSFLAAGIDLDERRSDGTYVPLDAESTLDSLLVDGEVDIDAFHSQLSALISQVEDRGAPVRIFGEMVALLWTRGALGSVLRLEEAWNELSIAHDFSLFCAYPVPNSAVRAEIMSLLDITARHNRRIPGESYERLSEIT